MVVRTHHIKLTRVQAPPIVTHSLLLVEDERGAASVRMGATPEEAAQSGVMDTIPIDTLSGGGGQLVRGDPTKYEYADGILTDAENRLYLRGRIDTLFTLGTGLAFKAWDPGGLSIMQASGDVISVTPTAIYRNGASVLTPLAGTVYTGSFAVHGARIFFGVKSDTTRASQPVSFYDTVLDTWSTAGSFSASFLAVSAEKMWIINQTNDRSISLQWTDDIADSSPIFSAAFVSELGFAKDLTILGPHAIITADRENYPGSQLYSLDTDGLFTRLTEVVQPVAGFTPLLGGQLAWQAGGLRAIWLRDIASYRALWWPVVSHRWATGGVGWPRPKSHASDSIGRGAAAVGVGQELFFSAYGLTLTRGQVIQRGSSIFSGRLLTDQGLAVNMLATPETVSQLLSNYVMAMTVFHRESNLPEDVTSRALYVLLAKPIGPSMATSDVILLRIELWEDAQHPLAFDTSTKFLRTSMLSGRHWVTKKLTRVRGVINSRDSAGSVDIKLYLDNATTPVTTLTITADGKPFSQTLDETVLARGVTLDFETVEDQDVSIDLPIEIDYFAVPDEWDLVQVGIDLGRGHVDRAGGLTGDSRSTTLKILQDLVAAPERWTLSWWDNTPDWEVIPIGYREAETEGEHASGMSGAVAWLTLRRVK